jgi:hypothetical protein
VVIETLTRTPGTPYCCGRPRKRPTLLYPLTKTSEPNTPVLSLTSVAIEEQAV